MRAFEVRVNREGEQAMLTVAGDVAERERGRVIQATVVNDAHATIAFRNENTTIGSEGDISRRVQAIGEHLELQPNVVGGRHDACGMRSAEVLTRGWRHNHVERLRSLAFQESVAVGQERCQFESVRSNPSRWDRDWTFTVPLTEDDERMIHEYACRGGNYAVPNILSGARAEGARRAVPTAGER